MPSHRIKSGTQAMDGTERSACRLGSSSRLAKSDAPVSAPTSVPAIAPAAKPASTRPSVAETCVQSSPLMPRV